MSVKVRKRNGAWWVFVNYHSRRKAKKVGTREAAEKVKRQIEARLALGDLGVLEEHKGPTFAEYAERWLRQHAEIQCKPSTVARYREILRLYLLPAFGAFRLSQITRAMVKELLSEKASGGRLSRGSLRLMLCTLGGIFSHAIDDELVANNPATKLGKFTNTGKPNRQATALTRREANRLLQATKEYCPQYYALFLTALRSGLRRGELVALRWGDIQFGDCEDDSNRHILVQHNYVQGGFTSPKGKRNRRVDLSKQLRRELLASRDTRLFAAFQAGQTSIAEDLVFPSQAGTVLDPANLVRRYFLPCVEKAGLRRIRFHDLRHTFGSLLIQDGAPLPYVKEQMGHSSIQITVDVYGHLIPGADIGWMDRQDSETSPQLSATQAQPSSEHEAGYVLQVTESNGGTEGDHTTDVRTACTCFAFATSPTGIRSSCGVTVST